MAERSMNADAHRLLEILDARLKTILPEDYQETYETLEPAPMRSAGLKYGADGKVAWDEIWGGFCDLAMAGGPPHKGALLEPARPADIREHPGRYQEVVDEICRGVSLAADLDAGPSPVRGWIRVSCYTEVMANWLLRAITMENVAVRRDGADLDLPASPHFRLEKEIKNVITVIAKTCHYWMGHVPRSQKYAIADLFVAMTQESPLVEPAYSTDGTAASAHNGAAGVADAIRQHTGLRHSSHHYAGWQGLECPSVRAAVWMMRAMVASNVLSRREGRALFVPINPVTDPEGEVVVRAVARAHRLAGARGVR